MRTKCSNKTEDKGFKLCNATNAASKTKAIFYDALKMKADHLRGFKLLRNTCPVLRAFESHRYQLNAVNEPQLSSNLQAQSAPRSIFQTNLS